MRALVCTRKGLFRIEHHRDGWRVSEPRFLGIPVLNAMRDPRDGAIWACIGHGHWGPKLHVSRDDFETFTEVTCPAFPDGCMIDAVTEFGTSKGPASIKHLYTIVPGATDGVYHIGTDPGGFFTTRDGAETWELNESLWTHRNERGWLEGGGGVMLHTILVTPGDPDRIFVGVSCAGVIESRDGGATWEARNKGVPAPFLPGPEPEVGQDTHMLRQNSGNADHLWQQNHDGNFRSEDGGLSWRDTSEGLPTRIGFALALHDDDPAAAWTIPMKSDMERVAPDGELLVWRTGDGGGTWQPQGSGLPEARCFDIVMRHALDARGDAVAFGTNCGRVFASTNGGDRWEAIEGGFPPVYAVAFER